MSGQVEDEPFRNFFRVPQDSSSRDRLSVLACEMQGFAAADLMFTPLDAFQKRGVAREVSQAKFDAVEQRRRQYIALAEQERQSIVDCLRQAEKTERLNHEQNKLHTLLVNQPGECVSNDVEESELIKRLLQRESSRQTNMSRLRDAIRKTKHQGAVEVEKLRERQIRAVRTDISLELERQEIISALDAKEVERKELEEARRLVLKHRGEQLARDREWKIVRLRRRNEEAYKSRRNKLEELRHQRDRILEERQREINESRHEKYIKSEQKMQHVKDMARSVQEEELSKCELLQHELQTKDELHGERSTNLALRQKARLEMRIMDSMRRMQRVKEHLTHEDDGLEEKKALAEEKLEEAARRKAHHDAAIRRHFRELELQRIEQLIRSAENRQVLEQEQQRKNEKVNETFKKKLEHVQEVKTKWRNSIELTCALHDVKQEQHVRNVERLHRRSKFMQSVKDALVKERQEAEQARERQRHMMALRLQSARQRILEEKEQLIDRVSRLRTSPRTPMEVQELLEKELSASRRGRQSSPTSTRPAAPPRTHSSASGDQSTQMVQYRGSTPLIDLCAQLRPSTS